MSSTTSQNNYFKSDYLHPSTNQYSVSSNFDVSIVSSCLFFVLVWLEAKSSRTSRSDLFEYRQRIDVTFSEFTKHQIKSVSFVDQQSQSSTNSIVQTLLDAELNSQHENFIDQQQFDFESRRCKHVFIDTIQSIINNERFHSLFSALFDHAAIASSRLLVELFVIWLSSMSNNRSTFNEFNQSNSSIFLSLVFM